MTQEIAPVTSRQLDRAGFDKLPQVIVAAGEQAAWRFIEFFIANIRNKNTRAAYAQAVTQFFKWCDMISLCGIHSALASRFAACANLEAAWPR